MPENLDILHYIYFSLLAFIGLIVFPLSLKKFSGQLSKTEEPEGDAERIPTSHINFADALFVLLLCGFWAANYLLKDPEATYEINSASLVATLIYHLVFIGIVTLVWCFRVNLIDAFGLQKFRPRHLIHVILMLVIMWLAGIVIMPLYMSMLTKWGLEAPLQDSILFLQESKDVTSITLFALVAVIGAPLCEETLFRGYIYPTFKRFTGIVPSLLCSGLFFSVIHNNLFGLPLLFLFGVLLALSYELTRTLWVPILGHMIFNGVTVLFQLLIKVGALPTPEI